MRKFKILDKPLRKFLYPLPGSTSLVQPHRQIHTPSHRDRPHARAALVGSSKRDEGTCTEQPAHRVRVFKGPVVKCSQSQPRTTAAQEWVGRKSTAPLLTYHSQSSKANSQNPELDAGVNPNGFHWSGAGLHGEPQVEPSAIHTLPTAFCGMFAVVARQEEWRNAP
nr:hypothetical protein CFP56_58773 [Quercus suber]